MSVLLNRPSFFMSLQRPWYRILSETSRLHKRDDSHYSSARESSTSSKPDESTMFISNFEDDNSAEERELDIERMRDKSRLKPHHRNALFEKKPYEEPLREHHLTVKYNRRMYGKYGSESGVNPGIMWPTKEDLNDIKAYEKVAYPFTLQEMVIAAKKEIEAKEEKAQIMQANVVAKFAKLHTWKKELKDKIAKKEAEALAARAKKAKMVEEVRRHFGFTIDPKDSRFQEMLAAKEKEQIKKDRQDRLEQKERKAVEKLLLAHSAADEGSNKPDGKVK